MLVLESHKRTQEKVQDVQRTLGEKVEGFERR